MKEGFRRPRGLGEEVWFRWVTFKKQEARAQFRLWRCLSWRCCREEGRRALNARQQRPRRLRDTGQMDARSNCVMRAFGEIHDGGERSETLLLLLLLHRQRPYKAKVVGLAVCQKLCRDKLVGSG